MSHPTMPTAKSEVPMSEVSMSEVTIEWLGQAGFVLRAPSGTVVFDPYLSDLCEQVHGLRRQVPAPCRPAELGADLVLVSHWHEDHLDLDSANEFVTAGARFIAPPSCIARLAGRGIEASGLMPLTAGQTVTIGAVSVTAVPALHLVPGFLTEDAVGYLVESDGRRVYHCGDTEYDRRLLAAGSRGPLDAALLCSNGTGGNMNVWEAALVAAQLQPALAVPMHFGMWTQQGYGEAATLDPRRFVELYGRLSPGAASWIPELGMPVSVGRR